MRHLCLFVVVVVAACSSPSERVIPDGPGGAANDATGGDGAPNLCGVPAAFGSPTAIDQHATSSTETPNTPPTHYSLAAKIAPDNGTILIDLYMGYGVFMDGLPTSPKTYLLGNAEASQDTCGACISINVPGIEHPYFATGGMLNLTSVTPQSLAGSLMNVSFTHVMIDDASGTTTPLTDGCRTGIYALQFGATPVPQ